MAGPTITVSVLADTTKAQQGFEDLEEDVKESTGKVKRSTAELGEATEALDGKANSAERGFRGFSDSLNGTSDVMGGLQSGNLVQLGMGMADLFGAVQDLFLPLLQQMAVKLGLVQAATEGQTVAQEAENVAMSANPIGLVVAALAALAVALYLAWTKSETFRDIVTGAFDAVTGAAQATWSWIKDNWPLLLAILTGPFGLAVYGIAKYGDDVLDIIKSIPRRIVAFNVEVYTAAVGLGEQLLLGFVHGLGGIGEAVGGEIVAGIKAVVNGAIDAINSIQIHLHIDPAGRFGPSIDFDWGGLRLPHLAQGGFVRGTPTGTLAVIGDGVDEAVVPLRPGVGLGSTTIYYPAGYNRREVVDAQRRFTRLNPAP